MCAIPKNDAGAKAPGMIPGFAALQKRRGLTAQQNNAGRAPAMAGGSLLGGGGPRLSMGSSLLSS